MNINKFVRRRGEAVAIGVAGNNRSRLATASPLLVMFAEGQATGREGYPFSNHTYPGCLTPTPYATILLIRNNPLPDFVWQRRIRPRDHISNIQPDTSYGQYSLSVTLCTGSRRGNFGLLGV